MAVPATVKLLVIDDDADDRKLVCDWLNEADRVKFSIDEAASAEEGIAKLEKGRFDVVLLDYRMPEKDGFWVLDRMKETRMQVPVVIVTSHGDRSVQTSAFEYGVADYLEKGAFTAELLERTCLYAIGLNEKKMSNGSGPGVGVLMEQLVSLTRDAVKAQSDTAQEIRELRRELGSGIDSVKEQVTAHGRDCQAGHTVIVEKVEERNAPKGKWLLDWIAAHPLAALVIGLVFLVVILALGLLVPLWFEHVTADQIKALKDSATGFLPAGREGILPWV